MPPCRVSGTYEVLVKGCANNSNGKYNIPAIHNDIKSLQRKPHIAIFFSTYQTSTPEIFWRSLLIPYKLIRNRRFLTLALTSLLLRQIAACITVIIHSIYSWRWVWWIRNTRRRLQKERVIGIHGWFIL